MKEDWDMDINFCLRSIVLQPTTLCNLDCIYCYLGGRHVNQKMPFEVSLAVARGLEHVSIDNSVNIIWHGGEPLACGLAHFEKLLTAFQPLETVKKIRQVIQTNATLIDLKWCDFFRKHNFHVGVSIDGPVLANSQRVDWAGKPTFDQTMKGIRNLKDTGIDFTIIAVINKKSLDHAEEIFNFFCNLGCSTLGINFIEKEGANPIDPCDDDLKIKNFWSQIFLAWEKNPKIEIREFNRILSWMKSICEKNEEREPRRYEFDIFPTVSFNGNVVFLSPELLDAKSVLHNNFVVGNVCREGLPAILERGNTSPYISEYKKGVALCYSQCKYFPVCRGGQASNKFFELDRLDATETVFCRNTIQRPVEAILSNLSKKQLAVSRKEDHQS